MGADQSKPAERPRQNKSNPPPLYIGGVNTTPTPKHDGPQRPATMRIELNPEQPGDQCSAELAAKLSSLERAISELQRPGAPISLKQAILAVASKPSTAKRLEAMEDQLRVMKEENQSLKEQKRNLEAQKNSLKNEIRQWAREIETMEEKNRSLEEENKCLEEKKNRLEGVLEEWLSALRRRDETRRHLVEANNKLSEINGRRSSSARELEDDQQTIATEASI